MLLLSLATNATAMTTSRSRPDHATVHKRRQGSNTLAVLPQFAPVTILQPPVACLVFRRGAAMTTSRSRPDHSTVHQQRQGNQTLAILPQFVPATILQPSVACLVFRRGPSAHQTEGVCSVAARWLTATCKARQVAALKRLPGRAPSSFLSENWRHGGFCETLRLPSLLACLVLINSPPACAQLCMTGHWCEAETPERLRCQVGVRNVMGVKVVVDWAPLL